MKLTIITNFGNIHIEVYPDKAPMNAGAFLKYVETGFYQGTTFHRTMPGFIIQGGGLKPDGESKWPRFDATPLESKNGLYHKPYSVAMARVNDSPDSATSEFFINLGDNPALNHSDDEYSPGYTVIGQVLGGFDVVEAISVVPTQTLGPYSNLPLEPVIIEDVVPTTDELLAEPTLKERNMTAESTSPDTADQAGPARRVRMTTNLGDIVVELHDDKAPVTVANFLGYVADGFYDGTIFHRVIDGFMIQGGGYDENLNSKERKASIVYEGDNGLSNEKHTISMARAMAMDSASSEFFINLVDNAALDHAQRVHDSGGYCVFGRVVEGGDIVDKIGRLVVLPRGHHEHVPVDKVIVEKAVVEG